MQLGPTEQPEMKANAKRWRAASAAALVGLALAGCPEATGDPEPEPQPPETVFEVGVGLVTDRAPNARGLVDRRGQIHAHSVYSHDACDGEPVKDGQRDPACFDDFRYAVCQTKQDFVFLTDHGESFDDTPFEEALLYRADRGDELLERSGGPVANRLSCEGATDDGFTTLLMGGTERDEQMPVGIEGHIADVDTRGAIYSQRTPAHAQQLRDNGAVILLAHPEGWTADDLATDDLDGFEMFNLHRLFMVKLIYALDLAVRFSEGDPTLPHPDLVAIRLIEQDPLYLELWSDVVQRGHRKTMTFGTDCHQNTLPGVADDGERIDSYRRMMGWMSNHLLVDPGNDGVVDDRELKAALKAGRLYGAFEMLGSPTGFDFVATAGETTVEMGGEAFVDDGVELVVTVPDAAGLWERDAPEVSAHLLRATTGEAATWEEVAMVEGVGNELRHPVDEAGVYRVEVKIIPRHLSEELGDDAYFVMRDRQVWIMSNPIYVR